MRYACNLLNKYSEEYFFLSVEKGLKVLGFIADTYDVFFEGFNVKEELGIIFKEEDILKMLRERKGIKMIKIKSSEVYSKSWFSLTLNRGIDKTIGDTFLMEWSICNGKLDFLLNNAFFESVIINKSLVYCYCYNQTDVSEQSNTHFNKYGDIPKGIKLVENKYGDKQIDISKNWGKSITIHNLKFVAASMMWFGLGFNPVFSIDNFRKFRYVTLITDSYAYIELFNLYEEPVEFRKKQKIFWNFVNSNRIIERYESENKLEFTNWLLNQGN